jgi:hypothetical protein
MRLTVVRGQRAIFLALERTCELAAANESVAACNKLWLQQASSLAAARHARAAAAWCTQLLELLGSLSNCCSQRCCLPQITPWNQDVTNKPELTNLNPL